VHFPKLVDTHADEEHHKLTLDLGGEFVMMLGLIHGDDLGFKS
jgi:hypothetical protein